MAWRTQGDNQDIARALGLLEKLAATNERQAIALERLADHSEMIAESLDAFNGMQSALINRYDGIPDDDDREYEYIPPRPGVDVELPVEDTESPEYSEAVLKAAATFDSVAGDGSTDDGSKGG